MQQRSLHIVIADSDIHFGVKLRDILEDLQLEMPELLFDIMVTNSIDELKVVFDTVPVELAFIDYFLLGEKANAIEGLLGKLKTKCHLVMLIPEAVNDKIYDILEKVDTYKNIFLSGHILKENYSPDLVRVLAKVFIKKVIR